jgi:5-methylcytosine-specific restriction endonuclease McrA
MSAYCRQALRMSKETAFKRIRVARTAHQFPAIYDAIADSRLHMCAVVLLAPHLKPENAEDLLAAAFNKADEEIALMLAERFPRSEWMTVEPDVTPSEQKSEMELSVRTVEDGPAPTPATPAILNRTTPAASGRFGLQCMVDQETQDLMNYAKTLVGHHTAGAQLPELMKKAFVVLVRELEKKKFAATDRPRKAGPGRTSANPRHIPADVKNEVWLRDQARCTFVSEGGHRCDARSGLQFDHIEPVARGGKSAVANLRLRCHAHNQYEADRTFGAGFMQEKRDRAKQASGGRRVRPAAPAEPQMSDAAAEVVPWLRGLGFKGRGSPCRCGVL